MESLTPDLAFSILRHIRDYAIVIVREDGTIERCLEDAESIVGMNPADPLSDARPTRGSVHAC